MDGGRAQESKFLLGSLWMIPKENKVSLVVSCRQMDNKGRIMTS